MIKRSFYIIVLFFFSSFFAHSQVWNLRLGLGGMNYTGDLADETFSFFNTHPAVRIGFGAEIYPRLAFELTYLNGKVSSENKNNLSTVKQVNFTSTIKNFAILLKYRLVKMNFNGNKMGFAILGGVGSVAFNPIETIQGTRIILSEIQREGVPYELSASETNIGVELSYMINRRWIVSGQTIFHITSTDYLDDVSLREDPNTNDTYFDSTISLIYRFGTEAAFKSLQAPLHCHAFLK